MLQITYLKEVYLLHVTCQACYLYQVECGVLKIAKRRKNERQEKTRGNNEV